jgi:predicted nucleic acid-binding protein
MILADTSVWIELLSHRPPIHLDDEVLLRLVTCGPVVQEVLRGLRRSMSLSGI